MNTAQTLASFRKEILSSGSVENAMSGWLARLRQVDSVDPAIWINRFSDEQLLAEAAKLDKLGDSGLPLFGLPFAVKDNIDVAGLPTTAGCPDYTYQPSADATVVSLLRKAGAICIGKTNLDQFATGLVGTRSPYGIPKNAWREDLVPGGSSAGSAVAVARGLVAFSLGTDTAGSGRVPAAFNGIVGWKPTRGLVSTLGVVPACRSLDCVSVFTASTEDLNTLRAVLGAYDAQDPFARQAPCREATSRTGIKTIAIPLADEMEFFGDEMQEEAWHRAIEGLRLQGLEILPVDCHAFFDAARLLYEGPWVAERYNVVRNLLEDNPQALHPVTREIISKGAEPFAWEAFAAMERLAELRRESERIWNVADALCMPTTGTIYSVEEVNANPVSLNSNLGFYTNFMNLLDLSAVAFPGGIREDALPFGLTLIAPAWQDEKLFRFFDGKETPDSSAETHVEVAVFGAHMQGFPLCHQIEALGGVFVREDRTAPCYRMVALDENRPGVIRLNGEGHSLNLEVWSLPAKSIGMLLNQIPSPLGLGKVQLSNGEEICGFLCEQCAAERKVDISQFGGWREYKNRKYSGGSSLRSRAVTTAE